MCGGHQCLLRHSTAIIVNSAILERWHVHIEAQMTSTPKQVSDLHLGEYERGGPNGLPLDEALEGWRTLRYSNSSGYDGTHRELAPSSMVSFTHSNFYDLIRVNFSWSDKIDPHCYNVAQCTTTSEEVGNGPQ